MEKVFSIWKGIVGKKGLETLKQYIESNEQWQYFEDDNIIDILSGCYKKMDDNIIEIVDKFKMRSFIIYHIL